MNKILKTTIVSSIVGVILSTSTAMADMITMNVGFGAPMKSIYGEFIQIFKRYAEQYTNGTVEVKLRPSNQISTEDKAFKAMQLGTVDAFIITSNNISPHWKLMNVLVMPYVFQNTEHMEKVVTGPVGDMIKQKLQQDTGVHMLTFGRTAARDFYNSVRPINSMADMKGLKIRVPNNEVMLRTFEAFGANPIPLAWSETPTALQTGTVEGGDNGAEFIRDLKFFEHQKHLVILEHFIATTPLLASDHFMKRLSPEQQQQIRRAAVDAAIEIRAKGAESTKQVRAWLVNEGGMKRTDPDRADFIKVAQEVQAYYADKNGPEFTKIVKAIQDAAK